MKNREFLIKELGSQNLVRPVPLFVRSARKSLMSFIIESSPKCLDESHGDYEIAIDLLGWGKKELDAFVEAEFVTHSSPHASMNVFAPNFAHPWLHRTMHDLVKQLNKSMSTFHLRTMVTHNNLGDLKYRPYAWWYRSNNGEIMQTSLFSRSHAVRRKVLSNLIPPEIDLSKCSEFDRRAISIARVAKSYSLFCILYRSALERFSGIQDSGTKLELPIDMLNAWLFQNHETAPWVEKFGPPRTVTEDSELRQLEKTDRYVGKLVSSNFMNFAAVYLFGISVITGGKKMRAYVPEMHNQITEFFADQSILVGLPQFLSMTELPQHSLFAYNRETREFFSKKGMDCPFALAVADFGSDVKIHLDQILEMETEEIGLGGCDECQCL